MKNKLLIRFMITDILILAILIMGVTQTIFSYQKYASHDYYAGARMLVNDSLWELQTRSEQGLLSASDSKASGLIKADYPYALVNLAGKVTAVSGDAPVKPGSTMLITEKLQLTNRMRLEKQETAEVPFMLYEKGELACFLIFYIPVDELAYDNAGFGWASVAFPFFLSLLCVLFLFGVRNLYVRKAFILPIRRISSSTQAIIHGDYDVAVREVKTKKLLENEAGELCYAFELMRDELREKTILEEELKKNQKELISCISHDLKTPLSTILAYGQGLRDGLTEDEEKRKKYAQVICNKALVVTKMINDLLEHSNAQLNQMKIDRKPVYFAEYFERLRQELLVYAEEKKVKLTICESNLNPLIQMDEQRITQVIYNLLENAVKYMDKEDAKIDISLEYRNVKQELVIRIQDNGPGISMEDIPYVFDKFYRAEKSRNSSKPGFGLGLSICKYIVEQHDGAISCISRDGTTFTITLSGRE